MPSYQSKYSWRRNDVTPYGSVPNYQGGSIPNRNQWNVTCQWQGAQGFGPNGAQWSAMQSPQQQQQPAPGPWTTTGQGQGAQGFGPGGAQWSAMQQQPAGPTPRPGGMMWHQNGRDGKWTPGGQPGNGQYFGASPGFGYGAGYGAGGVQGIAQDMLNAGQNQAQQPGNGGYGTARSIPNTVIDHNEFYGDRGGPSISSNSIPQPPPPAQPAPDFGVPGLDQILGDLLGGGRGPQQPQMGMPNINIDLGGIGGQSPYQQMPPFQFNMAQPQPQQQMPQVFDLMPFMEDGTQSPYLGFDQFTPYDRQSPMTSRSQIGVAV